MNTSTAGSSASIFPAPPLGPSQRQGNTAFAVSLALLTLRLMLGWTFVYYGSQKLFGTFDGVGMDHWIKAMTQMNLPVLPPAAWAYMAACGEFFGGLAVLIGLLTRLAAIPLVITMLVSIATVCGKNGFSGLADPVKGLQPGYEFNVNLIAMCVALLVAGPGMISVDAFLFKRGLWARGPQPLSQPGTRGIIG